MLKYRKFLCLLCPCIADDTCFYKAVFPQGNLPFSATLLKAGAMHCYLQHVVIVSFEMQPVGSGRSRFMSCDIARPGLQRWRTTASNS